MDCSLPGSSLHGILQAGILDWAAIQKRPHYGSLGWEEGGEPTAGGGLLDRRRLQKDLPIARFHRWIQWRLSWSSVRLLLREGEETNSEGDAAVTPLLAQLPASNEAGDAQKPVITGD